MDYYIPPLQRLIEQFAQFPGIGKKMAGRLAFHILGQPQGAIDEFADALVSAKRDIRLCNICQNLADKEVCDVCSSSTRDKSIVCVMEGPKDVISLERTHEYKGVYHVLHGAISPMDKVGPSDIKIVELLDRLKKYDIKEVIMATNLTIEGEATAMYISKLVKPLGVKVTRIAHGLPVGGDLEYADEQTIMQAINGRRPF